MNKIENLSFKLNGLMMAGAAVCGNEVLKIMSHGYSYGQVIPVAGAAVIGGILLDRVHQENDYSKLFRMCNIVNKDGKLPKVVKKDREKHTTLELRLPPGISQKHFEEKKLELEQGLNCKIELTFDKNLKMKLIEMNLKNLYDYTFKEFEKPLQVYIGESFDGPFTIDLTKCPHIIIAGETDSGKSSCIDTICTSLIMNKHDIDLHLIDFQAVTLGKYEDCKKVKSYGENPEDLDELLDELESENKRRRDLFRSVKSKVFVDKISEWNRLFPERALSYKVIIIDEFARLAEKDYEHILQKFRSRVSMDRKVGFHYIASMQRPDTSIIDGAIKANMPTRLAYKTTSPVDSEVILGGLRGAERLKIQGRFLAKYCGEVKEVHGVYIEPDEVRKLLKKHNKFKSKADIKNERKELIERLRSKCINPYLKGDVT